MDIIAIAKRDIKIPSTDHVLWSRGEVKEWKGLSMVFSYYKNGVIKKVTISMDSPKIDLYINAKLVAKMEKINV